MNDMDSVIKSQQSKYRVASKNSIEISNISVVPLKQFITVINDAYQNSLDKQMANQQTIGSISHWAKRVICAVDCR